MEGWISEKLQVALDEAYRDPTNLQSKLQKQAAFEAELQVTKSFSNSFNLNVSAMIDVYDVVEYRPIVVAFPKWRKKASN